MKKIYLSLLLFLLISIPGNTLFASGLTFTDVKASAVDINLYVDGTIGKDLNDGSSGSPTKTINAAINKLPQITNHSAIINVLKGTYPEDVLLSGYTGKGVLRIQGATNLADASNFVVNKIHYRYNAIPIYITGFTATTITDTAILAGYNPGYSEISNSRVVTTSTNRGIGNYYSPYVLITNCEISNRAVALYTAGGKTWSVGQTGTGNAVGLYAEKLGTIGKGGTQPTGSTMEAWASGGSVVPAN